MTHHELKETLALFDSLMNGNKLSNKDKNKILRLCELPLEKVQELIRAPSGRKLLAEKLIGRSIMNEPRKKRRPAITEADKLRPAQLYQELLSMGKTYKEARSGVFGYMTDASAKKKIRRGNKVHPPISEIPGAIEAIADSLLRQFKKHQS